MHFRRSSNIDESNFNPSLFSRHHTPVVERSLECVLQQLQNRATGLFQHFSSIYVFVEIQNTFSLGLEAEDQIRQNICQPPESDP